LLGRGTKSPAKGSLGRRCGTSVPKGESGCGLGLGLAKSTKAGRGRGGGGAKASPCGSKPARAKSRARVSKAASGPRPKEGGGGGPRCDTLPVLLVVLEAELLKRLGIVLGHASEREELRCAASALLDRGWLEFGSGRALTRCAKGGPKSSRMLLGLRCSHCDSLVSHRAAAKRGGTPKKTPTLRGLGLGLSKEGGRCGPKPTSTGTKESSRSGLRGRPISRGGGGRPKTRLAESSKRSLWLRGSGAKEAASRGAGPKKGSWLLCLLLMCLLRGAKLKRTGSRLLGLEH